MLRLQRLCDYNYDCVVAAVIGEGSDDFPCHVARTQRVAHLKPGETPRRTAADDGFRCAGSEHPARLDPEVLPEIRSEGPDSAQGHIGRRIGGHERHVDDDVEFRRSDRLAAFEYHAGSVGDEAGFLQGEPARHFRGCAAAQYDRDVVASGEIEHGAKALANRENPGEHRDDAGDTDDGNDGRSLALRQRTQVHGGDACDLGQSGHGLLAVPEFVRDLKPQHARAG